MEFEFLAWNDGPIIYDGRTWTTNNDVGCGLLWPDTYTTLDKAKIMCVLVAFSNCVGVIKPTGTTNTYKLCSYDWYTNQGTVSRPSYTWSPETGSIVYERDDLTFYDDNPWFAGTIVGAAWAHPNHASYDAA
jgi:hypothetical protein